MGDHRPGFDDPSRPSGRLHRARRARRPHLTRPESQMVAPMLLILTPTADPVEPAPADILLQTDLVNLKWGTGAAAAFQYQTVDISAIAAMKKPIRVQFRQNTTAAGAGYFT